MAQPQSQGEGCLVDTLIDLSEPAENTNLLVDYSAEEDKENDFPLTDSIEITRRDSLTLSQPLELEERILRDVTDKSIGSQPQPAQGKLSPEIRLIEDEEFDFDLPVSPADRSGSAAPAANDEDEEEVFLGPVGFREKCIAVGVEQEAIKPLSPLRPDQIAELAKEAFSVAYRISNMRAGSSVHNSPNSPKLGLKPRHVASLFPPAADVEKLVEDSKMHTDSGSAGTLGLPDSASSADLSGIQALSPSTRNVAQGRERSAERQRSNTFTKDEPVTELVQQISTVAGDKSSAGDSNKKKTTAVTQKATGQGSRLQAPTSRLTRLNRSASNLMKVKKGSEESQTSSSKISAPATAPQTGTGTGKKKSLQPPKQEGGTLAAEHHRLPGTSNGSALPKPTVRRTQSMKSGLPTRGSKLALPSTKLSLRRADPADQSQSQSLLNASSSSTDSVNTSTSSIPKGPTTKPQLLQRGQIQRQSLAIGRGRGTVVGQSGPVKVPAQAPRTGPLKANAQVPAGMGDTVERPYKPAQPAAKLGDTVERPYNPRVSVGPNPQAPCTPARGEKVTQPKKLSGLATPVRSSSSSSSVCGSTPGSTTTSRRSLLPTPSKQRPSTAGSLTQPSPMSVRSSTSSVTRRSVVSSSDAGDSPVFGQQPASSAATKLPRNRRISGSKGSSDLEGRGFSPFAFQSRKPLVQNTPDLPKRALSKWSPVRRPKPIPLEDQVSMCTKRTTSN